MAHPKLTDDELREVVEYLSQPDVEAEIHVEVPLHMRDEFEHSYSIATQNYPLPLPSQHASPYVASENRWGRECRLYFYPIPSIPTALVDRVPPGKTWPARSDKWRVNSLHLIMQLFECGFLLGADQDTDRIMEFMRRRFPQDHTTEG